MEHSVRTAPPEHAESRHLFEYAYQNHELARELTIRIDTVIDNLLQSMPNQPNHSAAISSGLATIDATVADMKTRYKRGNTTVDNWIDVTRLQNTASFARERFLLPLYFSDPHLYEARHDVANGLSGASTELLSRHLDMVDRLTRDQFKSMDGKNLRGAINEQTAMALINFSQSPSMVAVPTSLTEDVLHGVDLHLYRMQKDENGVQHGVRYGVSVKTAGLDAEYERHKRPDLIVISANDMRNLGLQTTRSLVALHAADPAFGEQETSQLADFHEQLIHNIDEQCHSAHATPVPDIGLGSIIEMHDKTSA